MFQVKKIQYHLHWFWASSKAFLYRTWKELIVKSTKRLRIKIQNIDILYCRLVAKKHKMHSSKSLDNQSFLRLTKKYFV